MSLMVRNKAYSSSVLALVTFSSVSILMSTSSVSASIRTTLSSITVESTILASSSTVLISSSAIDSSVTLLPPRPTQESTSEKMLASDLWTLRATKRSSRQADLVFMIVKVLVGLLVERHWTGVLASTLLKHCRGGRKKNIFRFYNELLLCFHFTQLLTELAGTEILLFYILNPPGGQLAVSWQGVIQWLGRCCTVVRRNCRFHRELYPIFQHCSLKTFKKNKIFEIPALTLSAWVAGECTLCGGWG